MNIKVTVDTSDVKRWVRKCARDVADIYLEEGGDIHDIATDQADRYGNDPESALAIIAAYGWADALVGSPSVSPWDKFVDEVEYTAKAYVTNFR